MSGADLGQEAGGIAIARVRLAWLVATLVLAGVVGPRLTPAGAAHYAGDMQESAAEALQMADRTLENPLERILFVQALRVREVRSLPAGTKDHLGTGPCMHEVVVRAYSFFWVPYTDVTVRCGVTWARRR